MPPSDDLVPHVTRLPPLRLYPSSSLSSSSCAACAPSDCARPRRRRHAPPLARERLLTTYALLATYLLTAYVSLPAPCCLLLSCLASDLWLLTTRPSLCGSPPSRQSGCGSSTTTRSRPPPLGSCSQRRLPSRRRTAAPPRPWRRARDWARRTRRLRRLRPTSSTAT